MTFCEASTQQALKDGRCDQSLSSPTHTHPTKFKSGQLKTYLLCLRQGVGYTERRHCVRTVGWPERRWTGGPAFRRLMVNVR